MATKTMKKYKDSFAKSVYQILHEYDLTHRTTIIFRGILNKKSDFSNTFCGIDGLYYHICYFSYSRFTYKGIELFITRRDKPFDDNELILKNPSSFLYLNYIV